jgi:hypothetical protein
MSFFSDLFEGNFGNLGTDLEHAPSSFINHPQEIAEVGGGALAALTLGASLPETAGLFGAGELAGLGGLAEGGTEAAAIGGADLGAADSLFGTFDAGLFGANAADVAAGGVGADLAAGAELGGLGGDVAGGVGSGLEAGQPGEVGGGFADAGAGDNVPAAGGGLQPPGGTAQAAGSALQPPGGVAGGTAPSVSGNEEWAGLTAPGATTAPAAGGSGIVQQLGGWGNIGKWALAGAPLALTLGMGEAKLPGAAQQLQGQAANLSAQGQADLASAKAGVLNQGQTAALGQMHNDLLNQWRQTLFNQGVTDLSKDARYPQILADVDAKVTAQTQTMIQQNITNALTETGQAAAALNNVAQMQMNADQAFTNNLVSATKSLGLMAAVSGGAKVQQVVNA